ncbi:uncharacterized protein I303_101582 [Kwoniella dejecticola CBS 10117]|uniref:RGS domain-containing protein n=1 Tax=Kwoniella dejecticola CBS 10117 TaxID=1296121 RepID=A0A1A6ADC6_9TREE|nr:uncharacterized protein I303_02285 [Kwoniella dejecticola CBS 10117]OBR88066.1 hypothetical protein I303_02285 [Kwoniella dejecticola CBS 10117]
MNEKTEQPPTTKEQRRLSGSRYLKLSRLPTLQEVLDRRTRPPLDLFCFYIFLQRESAEDALDFWLDVQQHENMCKAYFKDIKKSGRSIEEEWPEFAQYARTNGSHFAPLLSLSNDHHHHYSQPQSPNPNFGSDSPSPRANQGAEFDSPTLGTATGRERRDTESHGQNARSTAFSPTPSSNINELGQNTNNNTNNGSGIPQNRDRPSMTPSGRMSLRGKFAGERKSKAPTVIARDRAIEKAALVEGAERIYLRYLLPGAEREIYLPPSLRIHNFPISTSQDVSPLIPDLYHAQKVYIFKALEQDAFPRFLRAKAFGNLTPLGSFVRLILGLVCLWGGFVLAFSLIFLDWKPKLTRLWTILPFIFATNLLLSSYYSLSPLLALFNRSETTPFRLIKVKEPYVRKLLTIRALWIELVCILITAILVVIFTVVPGHRL